MNGELYTWQSEVVIDSEIELKLWTVVEGEMA